MSGIPTGRSNINTSPSAPREPVLRLPRQGLREGAGAGATGAGARELDSVQLRPALAGAGVSALEASIHRTQTTIDRLDEVGALLDELSGLVRPAADAGDGKRSDDQARVDVIIATITDASEALGLEPSPDGAARFSESSSNAVDGVVSGAREWAASLRNAAAARLAELKEQLRAALGGPQPSDEKQKHLDTLAALRKSLLGE